eukprot:9450093-Alexandrium_andersonii.AAC.1
MSASLVGSEMCIRDRGRRLWIIRRCSGSSSMPVSCWQSTWWATTAGRASSASSGSPPVKAGASLGNSCTA